MPSLRDTAFFFIAFLFLGGRAVTAQPADSIAVLEERAHAAVIGRQRTMVGVALGFLAISGTLLMILFRLNQKGKVRELLLAETNGRLESTNRELQEALGEVQRLKGLIPICSHCKKVRGDQGYWESVESYITQRSSVNFSHSICTECGPRVYGVDWGGDL